jgi:hypothetical protein
METGDADEFTSTSLSDAEYSIEKVVKERQGSNMEYTRLTVQSEAADITTIKALCESCGESGCDEFCEEFQGIGCVGCPVQQAFERLSAYEDSELSPDQVKTLKLEISRMNDELDQAKELFLHYHETYCGSDYCDEGCQVADCKFREIGTCLIARLGN